MERPILRKNPLLLKSNEISFVMAGAVTPTNINIGTLMTQVSNTTALGKVKALLGPAGSATYQTGSGIGLVNGTYNNI